jgi:uncharacterized integral membrane protein (TIGR00697 family)
MSNEALLLVSVLIDISVVFLAARLGAEWLYGTIISNLILIGVFGAKLVMFGVFATNVGNVFYACVFLATHFLLEQSGRKAGMKTIWFGVYFLASFTMLAQIATHYKGMPASDAVNTAITTLFAFSPRIIFASMLAYIFAQYINISVYEWIKTKTGGKALWLRSNGANVLAQLVDSSIFFSLSLRDASCRVDHGRMGTQKPRCFRRDAAPLS